ncbi:PIN domain-containing protein [Clostridium combesii]|uniref:DUF4935 domain-containing protein n=1 Tax=Clostridium combesii TaxID=39481 RepID=A0A2G7HFB3_9CLOT|nr:PIN domain-containing protein [Clostridium combesii]PIH03052.1 hypothetical protein CS538_14375 [Clostridium combesii]
MLNVFLDSNIIYNNPFMDSGINKRLLDKIKQINGHVYITDIIYKEVIHNYVKKLEELNSDIDQLQTKINRTNIEMSFKNIDVIAEQKKLESRFNELVEHNYITILNTDSNLLNEVIERAIKKIKPFSENKEEFRDCLIWLTYVHKSESDDLKNCFFITNNTSDFFAKDKTSLHPDLLEDSKRFTIYKGLIEFFNLKQQLFDLGNFKNLKENFTFKFNDLYSDVMIKKFEYELEEYINKNNNLLSKYIFDLSETTDIKFESYDIRDENIISTDLNIESKTIDITGDLNIYLEVSIKRVNETICTVMNINAKFYCVKEIKIDQNTDEYFLEDDFLEFNIEDLDCTKLRSDDIDSYMYENYADAESNAEAERMDALENYYLH